MFQKSNHADGDELFHRQLGSGRLPGDPDLPAADRGVGRHRDVVHGHAGVQSRLVLSGQCFGHVVPTVVRLIYITRTPLMRSLWNRLKASLVIITERILEAKSEKTNIKLLINNHQIH